METGAMAPVSPRSSRQDGPVVAIRGERTSHGETGGSLVARGETSTSLTMTGLQPETLEPVALDEPRVGRRVWAAFTLLVASVGIYVAYAFLKKDSLLWMIDLRVYHSAGEIALRGGALYDTTFGSGLPFTYTPFAGIVFAVTSLLPVGVLQAALVVGTLLAVVVTVWLVFDKAFAFPLRQRLTLTFAVSALAVWTEPIQQTLAFGQVNAFLMLLIVADLWQRDDRRLKGAGIGIATAIKLTPAIFIPYLALTGRMRAALVATTTFAGSLLLGWMLLPSQSNRYWIDRVFMDPKRVGKVSYVGNQSLRAFVSRSFGNGSFAGVLWFLLAVAVGIAGLALARRAWAGGEDVLGTLVSALTALLISPVSWSHHWVWIVPGLALLVGWAVREHSRLCWFAVGAASLVFFAWPGTIGSHHPVIPAGVIWFVPAHTHNFEDTWHGWERLAGNAELLAGVAAFVGVAYYLTRERSPTPSALEA
jgi:alpha-1,2-mannosyltransferase